jgi:hypothetical protein
MGTLGGMSQPGAPFPGPLSQRPQGPEEDRGFFRSPQRVAVLSFLAPFAYEVWWLWQLFAFTRREHFPRARAFWWLLLPFYNFYVIYQQLDDLKKAGEGLSVPARFNAVGATWLLIIATFISNGSSRLSGAGSLALYALSGVLVAIALYLVQQAANRYQATRYPGRQPQGMTVGEWIATVIGIVFLLLLVLGIFLPA